MAASLPASLPRGYGGMRSVIRCIEKFAQVAKQLARCTWRLVLGMFPASLPYQLAQVLAVRQREQCLCFGQCRIFTGQQVVAQFLQPVEFPGMHFMLSVTGLDRITDRGVV